MRSFSGYGLIIVVADYFGGLAILSKLSPCIFKIEKQQYIALLLFHIVITGINFCSLKYLNRKEVKHTVYGLRLEYVVLFVGILFLPLIIMMCKDVLYQTEQTPQMQINAEHSCIPGKGDTGKYEHPQPCPKGTDVWGCSVPLG